jgi:uncharacterized membrane protein
MKIFNIPINRFRILCTLGLMSASAVGLFILKALLMHDFWMLGINWNLFLAWVPIIIVMWLEKKVAINALQKWEALIVSTLWLLFFPNAPYIITDLVHLYPATGNKYWHYQIMIFSYAFVSLACGLLSLYWIQKVWTKVFSETWSFWAVIGAIILSGYGVFLGRIVRFNSWDFFTHPFSLLKYILFSFKNITAIMMTIEFSVFIGLAYLMFYSLINLREE